MNVLTLDNKLCKFADDTCITIPASNVNSRSAEVENIETWARINNLTFNRAKSTGLDGSLDCPTAATTWNCTCHVPQDPRCHRDQVT